MVNFNSNNSNSEVNQDENVKLAQRIDKIANFSLNMLRSIKLYRIVGYCFLILFILDVIEIAFPPRFLNPQWEFQVMGAIVERVAIPLIALLLIFYGGTYLRSRIELTFLKVLSWSMLIAGIVFLLSVPLGIVNTVRIYRQSDRQISQQVEQRQTVLDQIDTRLNEIKTEAEMQQLIAQISNRANVPQIENNDQVNQIKENLSQFIDTSKTRLEAQEKQTRKQQTRSLLKRSIKWNLGALISGFLFITAWNLTKWARVKEPVKTKE